MGADEKPGIYFTWPYVCYNPLTAFSDFWSAMFLTLQDIGTIRFAFESLRFQADSGKMGFNKF